MKIFFSLNLIFQKKFFKHGKIHVKFPVKTFTPQYLKAYLTVKQNDQFI